MEAHNATQKFSTETVAAAAVRHAADCIEELKEKGEPMGTRQTYRRGYNAGDEWLCNGGLSGDALDEALDHFGNVAALACKHDISGEDAVEFYRNQADALEA